MSIWNAILKNPGAEAYDKGAYGQSLHVNSDGTTDVVTHQDTDRIMQENADLRNDDTYTGDFQEEKWGRRVAQIPIVVYHQWLHDPQCPKTHAERNEWMLQRLDEPEWQHLKVVDEKVARKKARTYYRGSTASPKIVDAKGKAYAG